MEFRKAQDQDAEGIAALWHSGWHSGHAAHVPAKLVATRTADEFLERTRAHLERTVVSEVSGQLAGFYMLKEDELYQFYIDAGFRGTGAALEQMRHVEEAMRGRIAWLACAVGNLRAATFYEKCGWVRQGTFVYAVETSAGPMDVDEWRYQKDLR
ncbi:Acetyltransferase, GNAT family protein [Sulfitobacter noctilucicola]|uniref:GNAT superfamily N-acetyltransferase n=1 Tax=Sulfitobacter noctilucicola TaxID=1342301 RepID=A0A7W6Q3W0_9RHOB|nr:GNAT family N-acetyltransferase [Sulfitobacter noctilucicola]KIN61965.1 Acetyltransferase, GNAT family protein [Sulfitobacter noctilucicola]MBB4173514.1 GNAT superfamily N-acetyltransferase [Sulfitobacter noctilucicola]